MALLGYFIKQSCRSVKASLLTMREQGLNWIAVQKQNLKDEIKDGLVQAKTEIRTEVKQVVSEIKLDVASTIAGVKQEMKETKDAAVEQITDGFNLANFIVKAAGMLLLVRKLYSLWKGPSKKPEGRAKALAAFDVVMVLFSVLALGCDGGLFKIMDLYRHLMSWISLMKVWLLGSSWLLRWVGMDVCGVKEARKVSNLLTKAEKELFESPPDSKQPESSSDSDSDSDEESEYDKTDSDDEEDSSIKFYGKPQVEDKSDKEPEGFGSGFISSLKSHFLSESASVDNDLSLPVARPVLEDRAQRLWARAEQRIGRFGKESKKAIFKIHEKTKKADRYVILALICIFLMIAAHYWFKDTPKRKMREGKGKTKKGRGSRKVGTHKTKKNKFWKSVYCQGFGKIRDASALEVIDVKTGKKTAIASGHKHKRLEEIENLIKASPTNYKIRVDGNDSMVKFKNDDFVMGNGKSKKTREGKKGDSIFDQDCQACKKKFKDCKCEKKPEWFTVARSKRKFSRTDGCCHNPISCPLAKTKKGVPKINATQCCGIKCGGHHCTHWSQCLGADMLDHDEQEEVVSAFDFAVHNVDEEDICLQNSFRKEGLKKIHKQQKQKANSDSAVSKQKIQKEKKTFSDAVKAGLVKTKPESLLGRKQIQATVPAHASMKVLYGADGSPLLNCTFIGNKLVTVDHGIFEKKAEDGYFVGEKRLFIKYEGKEYDIDLKAVQTLTEYDQGNLIAFPVPKGITGIKMLKTKIPKKGENVFLPALQPENVVSFGKYIAKDEHTAPSKNGDCGSPLIEEITGRVVGIHRAGGSSENGFFEWTSDIQLALCGPDFQ